METLVEDGGDAGSEDRYGGMEKIRQLWRKRLKKGT